jgi:hypothetical protein
MAEYIERENAQIFLRTECLAKYPTSFANGLLAAADQLNKLPTADVVEVVRCKDCKHLMFSDCYGECTKALFSIVSPNDFCSYGERKEQE